MLEIKAHMGEYVNLLLESKVIYALTAVVVLDTILGILRAFKEKKFNSTVGINGAIRKAAMFVSVIILGIIDIWFKFDLSAVLPEKIGEYLPKIGICEFFAVLFIAYEFMSILKNMVLCGLPVHKRLDSLVRKFLDNFTAELPTIHNS
jgi:toxin secretion/phage lysis holin